jgi:dihydroflavonol-4-reductase
MAVFVVTGATGFIGWTLTRNLISKGHEVRCPVRCLARAGEVIELGAQVHEVDFERKGSLNGLLKGAEYLIHLAGATTAHSERKFDEVNVGLVEDVLSACVMQSHPPVTVLVSSVAASGPSKRDRARLESETPSPISAYGKSKLKGEQLALRFADRLEISIVRPAMVFGGHDRATLAMFQAIKRTRMHLSSGWNQRYFSIIFSDELADLLVATALKGERLSAASDADIHSGKGIYHACRSHAPTYDEIGAFMAKAMGIRRFLTLHLFQPLPQFIGWAGDAFAALTGKTSFLNSDKIRESLATSWIFDSTKAQKQLGFRPETPLLQKFEQVVAKYRAQGWL